MASGCRGLTGVKVAYTVEAIDVSEVDMIINEIVVGLVHDFRSQVDRVFTGGKGLSVNRISPEESVRLQREAQEAKAAVDPTVAGLNAMAQKIQAESAMTVAGLRYVGAGAEAFTQQVEAVADVSEVLADSAKRTEASMQRIQAAASEFQSEFESILMPVEQNRAIAPTSESRQKMLFASR